MKHQVVRGCVIKYCQIGIQGEWPSLVVERGDAYTRGSEFEYWNSMLEGYFHIDLLKKLYSLFEQTETKQKMEVEDGPYLKIQQDYQRSQLICTF